METGLWVGFTLVILGILFLDLWVLNRKPRIFTTREALYWAAFWVVFAFAFTFFVYFIYYHNSFGVNSRNLPPLTGSQAALQFFTAYILEKSLSLDNIFVMVLIFGYFKIPLIYQHRVLFWGILGVLVLRLAMILLGIALMAKFAWITYVFGAFLLFTAVKMLLMQKDHLEPFKNPIVALLYRLNLVSSDFDGDKFFTKQNNHWLMTPLFVALIIVETSDVLFALDSIPAVFAITSDPFLVFTSNIFAVMGLRSLYFAIANLLEKFLHLKICLVFLLGFIGLKMLLAHLYPISTLASLAIILSILSIGIGASLLSSKKP